MYVFMVGGLPTRHLQDPGDVHEAEAPGGPQDLLHAACDHGEGPPAMWEMGVSKKIRGPKMVHIYTYVYMHVHL